MSIRAKSRKKLTGALLELGSETNAIALVLTLAIFNVLFGVWRPKLDKLQYKVS